MNFINDRELACRFKDNAVPSRERFYYFFIFLIFTDLLLTSFVISNIGAFEINQWDTYTDLVELTLTIIGTIICYKTNKAGDDKEFIERYISIGFPVAIQTILIFIIGVSIANLISNINWLESSSPFDVLIVAILILYFYYRLNSSMKIAASNP